MDPGLSFAPSAGPRLVFLARRLHLASLSIFLDIAAGTSLLWLPPVAPHNPGEPSPGIKLGGLDKRENAEGAFLLWHRGTPSSGLASAWAHGLVLAFPV